MAISTCRDTHRMSHGLLLWGQELKSSPEELTRGPGMTLPVAERASLRVRVADEVGEVALKRVVVAMAQAVSHSRGAVEVQNWAPCSDV